jgi:site-specific DNA recombinase
MQPEFVEEFIQAFHEEINRQNCQQEVRVVEHQAELARVSKKLAGLYDGIADGLRTPGLQDQLLELEGRQTQLKELIGRHQHPPLACIQNWLRSTEQPWLTCTLR